MRHTRILMPYSKYQLNAMKKQDWQNIQDWTVRITENLCKHVNSIKHAWINRWYIILLMPELEDVQMQMLWQIVMMITYGAHLILLLDLMMDAVVEFWTNWYGRLASLHRYYSSRNIPWRYQLMEELFSLGVRFNPEHELI